MKTRISVLLPVYNGEKYLQESIESLLAQTRKADEILVVNDGSTDKTKEILSKYSRSITCLHQKRQGVWASRNLAVEKASGDFLAFMDADDISLPQRFEIEMAAFEKEPPLELIFGHMIQFKDTPEGRWVSPKTAGRCPGTLMIRKESFLKNGFFETRWKTAGFLHWYLRTQALKLKCLMLSDVVLERRIHEENSGLLENAVLPAEYAEVLKIFIDQKRVANE